MAKCIMYNDIADCDLAPCGNHCRVYVQNQINEPTCPRYASPLCDVCTPDMKQPGCYKDIPEYGCSDQCPDENNGCPMDDGSLLCGGSTVYCCSVIKDDHSWTGIENHPGFIR